MWSHADDKKAGTQTANGDCWMESHFLCLSSQAYLIANVEACHSCPLQFIYLSALSFCIALLSKHIAVFSLCTQNISRISHWNPYRQRPSPTLLVVWSVNFKIVRIEEKALFSDWLVGWLVGWVLWHINPCWLFISKSCLHTQTYTNIHMRTTLPFVKWLSCWPMFREMELEWSLERW